MLAAQSPNIARTIEDASATLAELRESSQAMGRLAIRLEKDLVQTISTVNSTAKSIDGAVTDIGVDAQKVLVELRRATESAIGLVREIQKMVAERSEEHTYETPELMSISNTV